MDAIILAAAGLERLNFKGDIQGRLRGEGVPAGLLLRKLEPEEMLPCVGQAAIGIEVRQDDERAAGLCAKLNHGPTFQCVTAERALLQAMGARLPDSPGRFGRDCGTRNALARRLLFGRARPPRRSQAPDLGSQDFGRAISGAIEELKSGRCLECRVQGSKFKVQGSEFGSGLIVE